MQVMLMWQVIVEKAMSSSSLQVELVEQEQESRWIVEVKL
jgi:hypothetical protein